MVDIENRYYHIPARDVDAEPASSRRWFKVGVALIGVSCLVLLFITASSISTSSEGDTGADKSTRLLSLPKGPPMTRLPQGAIRPRLLPPRGTSNSESAAAVMPLQQAAEGPAAAASEAAPFAIARRVLCATPVASTVVALCSPTTAAGNYKVDFEVKNLKDGGAGKFTVEVHPEWAPQGAARFSELVQKDFFSGVRFFRVVDGFVAQFGISGDPTISREWFSKRIPDDPVVETNSRGRLVFATSGKDSRTTQLFINFRDNSFLDKLGFSPFAEVVDGMDVVDKLYSGYGEGAPRGRGPDQSRIQAQGNSYLDKEFPQLSYIDSVKSESA